MNIRTTITLSIALLLASCTNAVKPPTRPVAYIYPTLIPMAALSQFTPAQLDAASLRLLLDKARATDLLNKAGLQDSELAILSRGLAKHGYAELDARRSKSPILWLSISMHNTTALVRVIYRNKPSEWCRFGIPTDKLAVSFEKGYYGERKTVSSATKDNVTLRNVKTNGSSSWEIFVSISTE